MKPLAWSPSALDTFKNCPAQYRRKYIVTDLPPEEKSLEQDFGSWVHLEFQTCQDTPNYSLPKVLKEHQPYMELLKGKPGVHATEQKVALTKTLVPVSWDSRRDEIWFRGIIDYNKVDLETRSAFLVDYKTGKPHSKFAQLAMYAIWTFLSYDYIDLVNAQFYWTKDKTVTKKIWGRADMEELWGYVVPDLKQFAQAFKQDVWQERPSGLCNGYCPVKDCRHWKPKRV
jgi:hypothetical protein